MEKTEGLYFFRVELLSSFFFPSWNYKDCLGTVKGECLLTTKASDSFVFRNLTIRSAKQPSTDSKSSNFT